VKTSTSLLLGLLLSASTLAQVDRIDPPGWWSGLQDGQVEVLIRFTTPFAALPAVATAGPCALTGPAEAAPSGRDLFVPLQLTGEAAAPCSLRFEWPSGRTETAVFRHQGLRPHAEPQGLRPHDTMYLLMPDRFTNGDPGNDDVPGMAECGTDRTDYERRHGGDLAGVRARLPELADFGITALWMTPVVENDMVRTSYHGYAATDLYRVDPRYGDWAEYQKLVEEAHALGIRVVHDWVPNHWGARHPLLAEPVDPAWVHGTYAPTNYRGATVADPHAVPAERAAFVDGWFARAMPDLDQTQPHLARYLTQAALWTLATTGADALRIDTYTYPDPAFMAAHTAALKREFPDVFLFGEAWVYSVAEQARLVQGNPFEPGRSSGLDATCDFQAYFALRDGLKEPPGWESGLSRWYGVLAQDFLYPHPERQVTFLDNHDLDRWRHTAGSDEAAWMGWALTLMGRGIPCIYAGSELGWSAPAAPDGLVRPDYPGGWPGDARDAFTAEGRTPDEQAWWAKLRRLVRFRWEHPALMAAPLEQSIPQNGRYWMAHRTESETVTVYVNRSDQTWIIASDRPGFNVALARGLDATWEVPAGGCVVVHTTL
jgi:glycosidase